MEKIPIYQERLSSNHTALFFLALTALSAGLSFWRVNAAGWDALAVVLILFAGFFLFYVVNYRVLKIQITAEALKLTFGIFTWRVQVDNIAGCQRDEIPWLMRMGGAGIHYMFIRGRYRVSFNFLEYPRVVIALKRKAGLVQDVSFSTRRPGDVLRAIQTLIRGE
jgi:hypothetical protein